MEISLFCLSLLGMMHSQIAFRGAIVPPAVDHTTMKEPHPEMTAKLLANTHLSTALEQHWEGRLKFHGMYAIGSERAHSTCSTWCRDD